METITAKLYEGMFLVDSALAAADWEGVNEAIRSILEKFGSEITSMEKWDERRLAYPIRGKGRGTYIRALFRVDGPKISEIERAIRLSDKIMRALILCVEDVGPEYINKQPQAKAEEKEELSEPAEDLDEDSDSEQSDDSDPSKFESADEQESEADSGLDKDQEDIEQ